MTRKPSTTWRHHLSELGKQHWTQLPNDVKAERLAKGRANYIAMYPERYALAMTTRERIESGELVTEPCDRCGGEGKPFFDYELLELIGWRCYACRKEDPAG